MLFDVEKLKKFPKKIGVYVMKNDKGAVLYVGKARNLQQRVRQYFAKVGDGRAMIPFLISQIAEIDTIVVSSEKEALILENNLIKQHKPKYNVLLKDDKTYIALRINNKHKWPMIQIVRYRGKPKNDALYFGPYVSAFAARMTLDLLNKTFPLRQCSDAELIRRTRPCILYGMKRCIAPCMNLCTKQEYDEYVNDVIKFLKGDNQEVIKDLYLKMHKYSEDLEYENAQNVLNIIRQIEKTVEKQYVDKLLGIDTDVIGIYRQADEVSISQIMYRGGRLIGSKTFPFNHIIQDDDDLISSFVLQEYQDQLLLPQEILIPAAEEEASQLEEILSECHGKKVKVIVPKRGEKVIMLNLAQENARESFKRDRDEKSIRERALSEMQEKLHLTRFPLKVECFDNSNISGSEPVASMVVFSNGEKDSKNYRKYKIKTASDSQDDYAAMYEVLTRRYDRAKKENTLPDLLIVDGGKGHLNIALKVFLELNIANVDVIGLAKEEGRHDKGITLERVFLPNIKDPIFLKKNSQVLFLLQRIRDEAHRFAITFHRARREKKMFKSELDDILGIGSKKKQILLKHFGSVKKIKAATLEELHQVKGLNKSDVERIIQYFKK